ncbi:hypothetical protein CQW23_20812 [Capsicum baccatum]|uniref:TF-B3 domain-containing protein n=1 Tax=Capsicum baccatum TaxID=33114 RepID=A0A2G2W9Q2_CAPBA|nr:hypothetical protein CQW23_20812 [Capsicum baccatum]
MDGAHPVSTLMVVRSLDVNKYPFRPQQKNEELLGPEIPYLSAIGALMYLANTTRPDIAFSVNFLVRLCVHMWGIVISWRSTKQCIIDTSSNHAEIIAIHEASREAKRKEFANDSSDSFSSDDSDKDYMEEGEDEKEEDAKKALHSKCKHVEEEEDEEEEHKEVNEKADIFKKNASCSKVGTDDVQMKRIPDTFVQKHGDELLDTVKLIVPTDDFWCVGVKKTGKMFWLHDGWHGFMEHHSVGCWYFLLFKYGQNSCFSVHIFDLAATEIDYQFRSHGNAKLRDVAQDLSHRKDKIVGGKSSVEIVDLLETEQGPENSAKSSELSHGAKRRKMASGRIKHLRCYETRGKTNKLYDDEQLLNGEKLNISGISLTEPLGGNFVRQSMKAPIHSAAATRDARISFTGQQREKSVLHGSTDNRGERGRPRAAEANRATNAAKMFKPENPHFMTTLGGCNVLRNHILNIPADFVRDYMPKTSGLIELQDSDGNKWNVRRIRRKMRMILSRGWSEFVRDNSLVVGDACVFELIKDLQAHKRMLKVHIFRSRVEENSTNLRTGSISEPTRSTGKNCTLQFNETKHTESSDPFEPASSDRTNHQTNTKSSFTGQQWEKSVLRGSTNNRRKRGRPRLAEANRANDAAKMFMSENPYFMVTLGEYNTVRNYILNIPPGFVQDYMPKTSEQIKLEDSDGNKWNVHCIRRKTCMFLSKGWVNFARDNGLVIGDTCVFELIKDIQADELMLKVHIFRKKRGGYGFQSRLHYAQVRGQTFLKERGNDGTQRVSTCLGLALVGGVGRVRAPYGSGPIKGGLRLSLSAIAFSAVG